MTTAKQFSTSATDWMIGTKVPTQWVPATQQNSPADELGPPRPAAPTTVLVADPGGALSEILRPALMTYAGCRIMHAGTVTDVKELLNSGVVGELAMVSLRFQGNTPEVIRSLRNAGWPRVLALTTSAVAVTPVIEAVKAGASGVLRIAGVVDVKPDPSNPARLLSSRELEVVRLVADGWSNKAIARKLSLSALTVKNHLARIGRKFGVGDRAHIVAIACRGGVIGEQPTRIFGPNRIGY